MKYLILILSIFFSATAKSEDITVAEMLSWKNLINEDNSGNNYNIIKKRMESVFHGHLDSTYSDSIKYYYYLINAVIEPSINKQAENLLTAVNIREEKLGILDPEYIEILWALGGLYKDTDIDSAACFYQKAIVVGETLIKNTELIDRNKINYFLNTYGMVIGDLANIYDQNCRTQEVVSLYNTAHNLLSNDILPFDVMSYYYKFQLAQYYERKGYVDKAITCYDDILNIIKKRVGISDEYIQFLSLKADLLCRSERIQEAIKMAEDVSLGNREKGADLYNFIGLTLLKKENYENALMCFFKSKENIQKEESPFMATILHNIGRAYMLLGNKNEAKTYLMRSKDLQMRVYGEIIPNTEKYLNELEYK